MNLRQPLIGAQMLFVAFGALVLVPLLTGLDTNVALFTAGVGTLAFQLVTKRQVPIFLASSFAFIPAIIYGVGQWGIASTMSGLFCAGIFYMLLSGLIALRGQSIVERFLPPVVVGPVIVVIGLNLAPVAVNMALGKTGDGAAELMPIAPALTLALISLVVTIAVSVRGKGIWQLVPILVGVSAGYIAALIGGYIDFSPISQAAWFAVPSFVAPEFNIEAILYILPVAIAPAVEHIGDVMAISSVTGKDYMKKPGLKKTMLGDGVATSLASCFGGPPNTTYSEVTGAVALTKAFDPKVMTWTAIFAIGLSFIDKTGAVLATIPTPVMGGIMTLLFGTIAAVGLNTLVKAQVDLHDSRNMIIVAITLVFGIGGMFFQLGDFVLQGIALSSVVAILLNLLLPKSK